MNYNSFYHDFFPFWDCLSENDRELLCDNSSLVHFDKEQSVHENIGCSGLYIVQSGRLRLYMLSEEGKEITLYRLSPGDICMLSASCVLQSISFDVYIDAEVPSDCYMINSSAFFSISEKYLEVKNFALSAHVTHHAHITFLSCTAHVARHGMIT